MKKNNNEMAVQTYTLWFMGFVHKCAQNESERQPKKETHSLTVNTWSMREMLLVLILL